MDITNKIKALAEKYEQDFVEIRRNLHQNAEVSMQEHKTARIIAEELRKYDGIKVFLNMAGGTGVAGVLEGGKPGKCILLRADIDALAITEKADVDFKSLNEGVMHACGHDAHAAWVLGAARILSELRDEVPGTIKFVFQPGEERGAGAKELIEQDKVLENPKVDYCFSAHAWPSIEAGKVGIAQKYAFGCPGVFRVKIIGKGGHGSSPHLAVNPIMVANQICTMLPQVLTEKIAGTEPRVITVCSIMGGNPKGMNIIPEDCTFQGTVRATKMSVLAEIGKEMENVVKACCALHGAEYEFGFYKGIYEVENNGELVNLCLKASKNVLGEENAEIVDECSLGGDNFSEFSRRIPSVYMYAGVKDKEKEAHSIHSPQFMIDESAIAKLAAVLSEVVFMANKQL